MQHLGCKTLEDFYGINIEDVLKYGGKGLIESVFKGSLAAALQSVYPYHNWLSWKFVQHVPHGFWISMKTSDNLWIGLEIKLDSKK
jgi:hypothetical protein